MNTFYIYILTNKSKTLYIGITNNLHRRIYEHKNSLIDGFSKKYKISKLIYFETFNYANDAITREKQLKGWLRKKKIELIETANPKWNDLYEELTK